MSSVKAFSRSLWNCQKSLLRISFVKLKNHQNIFTNVALEKEFKDYDYFHERMKNLKPKTLVEMFDSTVANYGDRTALMQKNLDSDKWIPITYNEYKNRTEKIAKAFIKLGLEEHGSVGILAFNSVEWFLSQLGAVHARGRPTGIYTTNSPDAVQYVLNDSNVSIVVVDTDEQLNKVLKVKRNLPNLKAIVKTQPPYENDDVWKWSDLEEMNTDDVEEEYARRLKAVVPTDCCFISYTSGTTGNPKGVILTHDNVTFEIQTVVESLQCFEYGNEANISYLPLSHMTGQISEILMSMLSASTLYFADKDALKGTLINTLRDARPTYFVSVPRVYEKIKDRITQAIVETKGAKKVLLTWAQKVTLEYHMKRLENEPSYSLKYEIAKKLVINKIKGSLGLERCKVFFVGAAPISSDMTKFFLSIDVILQEVYGMTEGTGISFMRAQWHNKLTSVGKVLPGLEAKIINPNEDGNGEICTRGRNTFMGYLNDAKKTKETIDDDGWLHSGDVGFIDNQGFLFLTGRIKELIVTAGGENVPYLHIENLVRGECQAISNTFLIGDKKKFLSMLISLKTQMDSNGAPMDELSVESLHLMKELNLNYTKLSEILKAGPDAKVLAALQDAIDRANKNAISNAQKVQKFAILPNDFSLPTGELNATMKLKRNFVLDKYKDIIDKFYD